MCYVVLVLDYHDDDEEQTRDIWYKTVNHKGVGSVVVYLYVQT